MNIIGEYQFGSRTLGLETKHSDFDYGELFVDTFTDIIGAACLANFGQPKNQNNKVGVNDFELMHLSNFWKQCHAPSINFLPKIMTLKSQYNFQTLRTITEYFIDWKAYGYRTIAFVNNTEESLKGWGHRIYAIETALHQLWNGTYLIDPKWWQEKNNLISRFVELRKEHEYLTIVNWIESSYLRRLDELKTLTENFPPLNNEFKKRKNNEFASAYYFFLKEIV